MSEFRRGCSRWIWWIYGSNNVSAWDWPSRNMTGGAVSRGCCYENPVRLFATTIVHPLVPPTTPPSLSTFSSSSSTLSGLLPTVREEKRRALYSKVGMQSFRILPSPSVLVIPMILYSPLYLPLYSVTFILSILFYL